MLEVEAPHEAVHPVGVDLNAGRLVVAADENGVFIHEGGGAQTRNRKTRKVRKRLQRKLDHLKAQDRDTHSVRRLLKRLGKAEGNRTVNEVRVAAKRLVSWVPADAIVAVENLSLPQVRTGDGRSTSTRRKMSLFPYRQLRLAIESRCEREGIPVRAVSARYTSQICNACGQIGTRSRRSFVCGCGHQDDADVNAAKNIRDQLTTSRRGGDLHRSPLKPHEGKPVRASGQSPHISSSEETALTSRKSKTTPVS